MIPFFKRSPHWNFAKLYFGTDDVFAWGKIRVEGIRKSTYFQERIFVVFSPKKYVWKEYKSTVLNPGPEKWEKRISLRWPRGSQNGFSPENSHGSELASHANKVALKLLICSGLSAEIISLSDSLTRVRYGYRGTDTKRNLWVLPTGELLYFVAAVAVLYDRDEEAQRHYTGHTEDIQW